jgi:CO/xanthine dehydrogenase FAD-binding subunit
MTRTFFAARLLEEAMEAMATGAQPIAGGTDLVVATRQGKAALPENLVALHNLGELRGISRPEGGGIRFGALTTHAEIAADPVIRERYTALADASAIVGSEATRANGTIGGNLMNASPAMETGGPLACLDATVALRSTRQSRHVTVADLFAGPGRTTARPDELLTAVELPEPRVRTGSCYVRLEYRRQMEIAVVGATCLVGFDGAQIADARIALTALAPTIMLVSEAAVALIGTDGGRRAAETAAHVAAQAAKPISDVRASAEYRRAMTAVIVRRAIEAAVARARGNIIPVPASEALYGVE